MKVTEVINYEDINTDLDFPINFLRLWIVDFLAVCKFFAFKSCLRSLIIHKISPISAEACFDSSLICSMVA